MSAQSAVAGRRFRPATAVDVERHGHRFTWRKPDGRRTGLRALVLEIDDPQLGESALIGIGRIGPNLVHPGRDMVEIEIDPAHRRRGHGTAFIREVGKDSEKPLFDKVVPGSERDMFLRALGVERLDLDNHPTDPHAAPPLMTLGCVETDPVELVEIPSGLTARLRDA